LITMNIFYVALLILLAFYVCVTDRNVPDYLILRLKLLRLDIMRALWGFKLRFELNKSLKKFK
jgi:hypothetical protein